MKCLHFIVLVILFSCEPNRFGDNCHSGVLIKNASNKVIYFQYGRPIPEITNNPITVGDYFELMPNESIVDAIGGNKGCYEDFFAENNNKLYFLLFDKQVLLNNTWDDVVANDLVLKRYSFTLQDMQAANWIITHSGD